jgi:hypothetical protein
MVDERFDTVEVKPEVGGALCAVMMGMNISC